MPKTIYRCDLCGKLFICEDAAIICEKNHFTVKSVKEQIFNQFDGKQEYPLQISCEMSNGEIITFYRHEGQR